MQYAIATRSWCEFYVINILLRYNLTRNPALFGAQGIRLSATESQLLALWRKAIRCE